MALWCQIVLGTMQCSTALHTDHRMLGREIRVGFLCFKVNFEVSSEFYNVPMLLLISQNKKSGASQFSQYTA